MICKIADLLVEIPATGNMPARCREYLYNDNDAPNIVLYENEYRLDRWSTLTEDDAIYMESGFQFYKELLFYRGMLLHASAVEMNGRAYLFSGPCRVGKSTHTGLWKNVFCNEAQIFNDDKPALRRIDDTWFSYGTPWCGKSGINQNKKVKIAGICFLKQGDRNEIYRLDNNDAIRRIISQTNHRFRDVKMLNLMLDNVDLLVREIPIYEMINMPNSEAVKLSYETMCKTAKEIGI